MIRFGSFLLPLLWVAWGCGTRKPVPAASSRATDTVSLHEMYYAAEFHYIQENWKQADSLFRRYIRSNMPSGPAYHRLACIAYKTGKIDEALALNAKARMADTSVEAWIWLDAELYRRKSEFVKAGDIYAAYTVKHPRAWTVYNDAARCYTMGGYDPSVLELCDRWEKAFGLMETIVEFRVQSLGRMGEPEKAAAQWAALRRKYPDRRYYRYNQINTLREYGSTDLAKQLLDTLMQQDPQDFELQALYCEMNTGYDTIISPYIEQIAQTQGMSFESKWKCLQKFISPTIPAYDSCEQMLRMLCKAHPKEPEALKALGLWCLYHGKAGDAAKFLRQTLNEEEQSLLLWQQYLTALSAGCEVGKMLSETDTLLELYSMVPESYQMKAISFLINGMRDDALRSCTDGERISDHNTRLVALKNYILIQAGKKEQDLDIDYVSQPNHTDAVMASVELALSQENWEKAESLLKGIFDDPENLEARSYGKDNDGNGWAFFQCVLQQGRLALITGKNKASAIHWLNKFLPESPVALELMGDLYGSQQSEALNCYEKALPCTTGSNRVRIQDKINHYKNR